MTALILVALALVIVWGAVYVQRGSLVAGGLLLLFACACFGHKFYSVDLGPVTLSLERIVPGLLLVAYVAKRLLRRSDPEPWSWVEAAIAAFLALLVVSTFTHDWAAKFPEGIATPTWRLLVAYLVPVLLYCLARDAHVSAANVRWVHGALALFGVYLAATGLLEIAGQWSFVFPRYIADPELGSHFGRARGPLVDAVAYGFALTICLLCAWMWRSCLSRPLQLVLFATLPMFVAALYFSYTRCVWMGAVLGVSVVAGAMLARGWRSFFASGIVAVTLLVGITQWDNLLAFQREHSAQGTRDSAVLRPVIAYISWQMFLDRPIAGCGFGQYYLAKDEYLGDRSTELSLEMARYTAHHNLFLALLVETGIVGLALFVAVLLGWTRDAWLLANNPAAPEWARKQGLLCLGVLAAYLPHAMLHDVSHTNMVHMFVFFVAGVTACLRRYAYVEGEESHADAESSRLAALPPVPVVAR